MSGQLWHITDDPRWTLDPDYRPRYAYWTASEVQNPPGLYVSDHPGYWNPYFGRGPLWAVRVSYHGELPSHYTSQEHPEYFLEDLDKIEVLEVIPLAEAIRRGAAEKRAGIRDADQVYGFGTVEDWWYACKEVWNDVVRRQERVCLPRKGLEDLMEGWKDAHGGRTPAQVYRWRERFEKKFGRRPTRQDEPWSDVKV